MKKLLILSLDLTMTLAVHAQREPAYPYAHLQG